VQLADWFVEQSALDGEYKDPKVTIQRYIVTSILLIRSRTVQGRESEHTNDLEPRKSFISAMLCEESAPSVISMDYPDVSHSKKNNGMS
jgi:hypothetical protein